MTAHRERANVWLWAVDSCASLDRLLFVPLPACTTLVWTSLRAGLCARLGTLRAVVRVFRARGVAKRMPSRL